MLALAFKVKLEFCRKTIESQDKLSYKITDNIIQRIADYRRRYVLVCEKHTFLSLLVSILFPCDASDAMR